MPIPPPRKMLYLDNGATTFPKPDGVIETYCRFAKDIGASPGRGEYEPALKAEERIYETRNRLAGLLGTSNPERIVFTMNATHAINLVLFGLLDVGDKVVSTRMEHNAVIRPLLELERRGIIEVSWAQLTPEGRLDIEHLIELAAKPDVKMVITTGMGNVTGAIVPFWDIAKFCREREIIYVVDAAQLAGSYPVNVEEDNIDILAFTGHKSLYGVPGTGGFYISERIKSLRPLIWGGTGEHAKLAGMPENIPEKFEAGTPNTPGIAALGEGVKWVLQQGVENMHLQKEAILQTMLEELRDEPNIELLGPTDDVDRTAIIPLIIDGIDPHETAQLLWKHYNIAVRAGCHCAPFIHWDLGAPQGSMRFSFGAFNTLEDAEYAAAAIKEIAAQNQRK